MILGIAGNPGAVQKVLLTPRQGGAVTSAQNNNPPPNQQPNADEEPDEGPVVDAGGESEYPGDQNADQAAPHPAFRRPMPPGGFNGYPPQQSPNGENDPNATKTPEELMQELQQMQEQQRQYEQQLNPANQTPQ